ncbi:uncharacterized protein LOC133706753 isoform X3 [Rosa rugosa]|uniref:uncharacterized protein LOC133706753 isoform X3 n=1 Tax=Rosa rugosa TaxID=74645 RepID=UPI002B40E58D|nr:uncharacterized protein LOC133706753 isoform X3 [Rosa rugosa]XP_061988280.1 uncharacterized protein LOC133706753 isoform X3 [Rosa rugosa]
MQMQEVAGERGGYLHGRGALDSDDLLYLKEQMEAEEDAERLLRRTEKRAFAAFKQAASLADSSPASAPLTLRVEPKQKSGIRQQDLLKKVVEVKPKKQKVASPSNGTQLPLSQKNVGASSTNLKPESDQDKDKVHLSSPSSKIDGESKVETTAQSLLGLAYASSEDED